MPKAKQPLENTVLSQLRAEILDGTFKSGAHIGEVKLSARYNVSRTPVREALSQLTAEGLVEMIPNRGAFVTENSQTYTKDLTKVYAALVGLSVHDLCADKSKSLALTLKEKAKNLNFLDKNFAKIQQELHKDIIQTAENAGLKTLVRQMEGRLSTPLLKPIKTPEDAHYISQHYAYLSAALGRHKLDTAEKTVRTLVAFQVAANPPHTP